MAIDIEKIKQKITEIKENIEKIKKYSSLPEKEFWEDERNNHGDFNHFLKAIIKSTL